MQPELYSVGDRVRYVEPSLNTRVITKGDCGIVTEVVEGGAGGLWVQFDDSQPGSHLRNRKDCPDG